MLRRNRAFLRFCVAEARRNASTPIEAVNLVRSVVRKLGVHHLLRSARHHDSLAIVDEGVIQAAHNVLVGVKRPICPHSVAEFARLVPKPDLIVHVRAPLSVLVARAQRRSDPPRRVSRRGLERFVLNAREVFEDLTRHVQVSDLIMTVDSTNDSVQLTEDLATEVCERIEMTIHT